MNLIGIDATLELILRGPVLVHSSAIGPWGVDAVALRDPAGHLIVPGDAVKGKIREAWDQIGGNPFPEHTRAVDMATFRDGENAASREKSHVQNLEAFHPFPLFFSDFCSVAVWPPPGRQTVSQTALDADTGTAQTGSLRTYDCPVLPGQLARFRGGVRFFCSDEDAAKTVLDQICAALAWVISFGSQKSVGYGRNVGTQGQGDARVIEQTVTRFSAAAAGAQASASVRTVLVDFSFCDPLCVPSGVVNGNIFESRDEIPGETLRGAVAELLKQIGGLPRDCLDLAQAGDDHPFAALCRHFSRIRFTTARPARPETAGPVPVLPRSWAVAAKRLFDFALVEPQRADELFDGEAAAFLCDGEAAAFCHDWKDEQRRDVHRYLGTVSLRRELRVRTAVETGRRRAKTHSLFAYRLLRPEGVVWRGRISLDDRPRAGESVSEADLQAAFDQCQAVLASGWLSVGKTRARGRGESAADASPNVALAPLRTSLGAVFVVTLRGPALMLDPRDCLDQGGSLKSPAEIDDLYAAYWAEVSDGLLAELPRHRFTQEALVGGFQARRYRYCLDKSVDLRSKPLAERLRLQKSFPYNPTLIVEAGSVFVLGVCGPAREAAATARVAQWLAHGLPLPDWAARAYGDTHHTNIFIPANGFGEIDVNLPCHDSAFESPLAAVGGRS
ncbi:MAG: hypothetical protein GX575_13625 [Candidatus Anammoximicrobium sp.]|nr:hypothetical protein [Candidatus Anammoximicrobium sp.]